MLTIENNTLEKLDIYALSEAVQASPDSVYYHLELLKDKQFVITRGGVVAFTPSTRKYDPYWIQRLTFDGCEYLESIRNDKIWLRVKQELKNIGGSASLEIVKDIAVRIGKDIIQNHLLNQ